MCLNAKKSIAGQHDDIILSDMDKTLQGPKIHLCAKFGYSAPCCVGVSGQRNKHMQILSTVDFGCGG